MKRVVLDASAIITLLDERPGADRVEDLLASAIEGKTQLFMSVVNWGEVYYSVWLGRGRDAAQSAIAELAQLPIEVVDADYELTKLAAELRAQYKLPYADSFAAALALNRKATLLTADSDFRLVANAVTLMVLPPV